MPLILLVLLLLLDIDKIFVDCALKGTHQIQTDYCPCKDFELLFGNHHN